jgi:hypothetical protein
LVTVPPNISYVPIVTAISVNPDLMMVSDGVSVYNITPLSFTIVRKPGDANTRGATYAVVGIPA